MKSIYFKHWFKGNMFLCERDNPEEHTYKWFQFEQLFQR